MKISAARNILDQMIAAGQLSYGYSASEAEFLGLFGVARVPQVDLDKMTVRAAIKQSKADDLAVLSVVDMARNVLLDHGMYLRTIGGQVQVALPSENAEQAERYRRQGMKKTNKCYKLLKNTPQEYTVNDNTAARAALALAKMGKVGALAH